MNAAVKASRRFDLIAFDWDGTLFDSTAIIVRCIQAAVVDVGGQRPSDEQAAFVIGLGLGAALAHAAPDVPEDQHRELAARYRYHYMHHQNDLSLFTGVLPMLEDLRARQHLLCVATGKSRRGLDEVLRSVQLQGMFDASRTADETASKPHPLMLQELMTEFDIPAHRVLMIGDTTHDLQMARHAGCAAVGVSYGAHDGATFTDLEPLHVASTVSDLHQWLLHHA